MGEKKSETELLKEAQAAAVHAIDEITGGDSVANSKVAEENKNIVEAVLGKEIEKSGVDKEVAEEEAKLGVREAKKAEIKMAEKKSEMDNYEVDNSTQENEGVVEDIPKESPKIDIKVWRAVAHAKIALKDAEEAGKRASTSLRESHHAKDKTERIMD